MAGIYDQYLSDKEVADVCGDACFIRQMLAVEIALAKVQGRLGIIPAAAAKEIADRLSHIHIKPEDLSEPTLANGIPTIPFLSIAKKALSQQAQDYVHWGATSQDIMDTATVLVIREVLQIFDSRLLELIASLRRLGQQHADTLMVARTRMQQAVPITFGNKVGNWVQPLERHLQRLEEMRTRLLVVQFGGAAGTLSALGEKGIPTAKALADALQLRYAGTWHSQRDTFAEFAAWMAMLGGSLGKMAQDILLLSQSEIAELIEDNRGGGKSSTMPHKNNPVLSEAMVALSRYLAQLVGNHFQAMINSHERDASAWAIEWLSLPSMMVACGTLLRHANTIGQHIQVNEVAMKRNLEKLNGLVYAEKATFLLSNLLSRQEAKEIVGKACEMVAQEEISLSQALRRLYPDIDIDWEYALSGI